MIAAAAPSTLGLVAGVGLAVGAGAAVGRTVWNVLSSRSARRVAEMGERMAAEAHGAAAAGLLRE